MSLRKHAAGLIVRDQNDLERALCDIVHRYEIRTQRIVRKVLFERFMSRGEPLLSVRIEDEELK